MEASTKVPAVTLGFWIIKIAATTLGETGGDTLSMTYDLGYLASTGIFLAALIALVAAQIAAKNFHPFLYWATIIASHTFGTTVGGLRRRFPRIRFPGGSFVFLGFGAIPLGVWFRSEGSV